ncbi:hypothetical protein ACIA8E_13460 [Streptomyces sp. NPDC051664]|uniref:hypothetical protein n=1 Tax=Streptomyces sp. NPDC051664 TaxID=3365668 RepID=UPI0037AB98D2
MGRAALVTLLGTALMLTALPPAAHAGARRAAPPVQRSDESAGGPVHRSEECNANPASCHDSNRLYQYIYSLGIHPFTSPHDVLKQLTGNFWLFSVRGACPTRIHPKDECALLGGNPVRVEAIEYDHLQIATLPGHVLGDGLHIRFTFTRSLGFHYLIVSAWQRKPTACTEKTLCNVASRVGAWALWRVLAETLAISAYLA